MFGILGPDSDFDSATHPQQPTISDSDTAARNLLAPNYPD